MKALIQRTYCDPEDLKIEEIAKPKPGENELLVKIMASAVNDYDWSMIRGKPAIYKLLYGFPKPKNPIPGMELSGIVVEKGPNAEKFDIGDAVFGDISGYGFGSHAEYLSINENALIKKPEKISHEEAASIPHAAMLAWQSLKWIADIGENQDILINGAGGGVGMFGLQIARLHRAKVCGVDSGDKLKKMKELGFDELIDYKKEDFTKSGKQYDIILDTKTTRSLNDYAPCLKDKGTYVTVGGTPGKMLSLVLNNLIYSINGKKKFKLLPLKAMKGMDEFMTVFLDNNFTTQIDGPYPFEEIKKAIRHFGEAKHNGKVIIKVSGSSNEL